jgi:hypothetical protein
MCSFVSFVVCLLVIFSLRIACAADGPANGLFSCREKSSRFSTPECVFGLFVSLIATEKRQEFKRSERCRLISTLVKTIKASRAKFAKIFSIKRIEVKSRDNFLVPTVSCF